MPRTSLTYVSEGLARFPLLVWKRILEYCWDLDYLEMLKLLEVVNLPDDFLSDPLSLQSVKQNVCFHAILPILMSNYVGEGTWTAHDDHPSLLDFKDIANCRLVCGAWNAAIRNNVQNHASSRVFPNCCLDEWGQNFLYPKENHNPYADMCNRHYPRLRFPSDIRMFLDKFRKSHYMGNASPFHCHHVGLQLSNHGDFQDYLRVESVETATFFLEYGIHLRRLMLDFFCTTKNGMVRLYPGVFDLIVLSPYLEALRISWCCEVDEEGFWKYNAEKNEFRFHELKLLTHLELNGVPYPLFNDIINSVGAQLEKLKLCRLGERCALLRNYKVPAMENLRELRISFYCPMEEDFVCLGKYATQWTKLEKLHLDIEGDNSFPKSVSWRVVLQCVNKFSKTLTHLWIRFPTLSSKLNANILHDYRPTREERLRLPNLEQVVLKFPGNSAFSLEFLRGLAKMETIYIHERRYPIRKCNLYMKKIMMIHQYEHGRRPENNSYLLLHDFQFYKIWEHLPTLSKLYRRQRGYECAWEKINGEPRVTRNWNLTE